MHYSIPERAQAEGIFLAQQLAANTYVVKFCVMKAELFLKGFIQGCGRGGKLAMQFEDYSIINGSMNSGCQLLATKPMPADRLACSDNTLDQNT